MTSKSQERRSTRQMAGWIAVVVASAVGLADAVYLLMSHVRFKTGGNLGGLCDISEKLNCTGAIESAYSTLFGIPVPVWAVAFYAAMMLLALRLLPKRGSSREDSGWSLVLLGYTLALMYSLVLLSMLVFVIEVVCPGCLLLDVANLVAVVGAVAATGGGLVGSLKRAIGGLTEALFGSSGLQFGAVFLLVMLGTGLVTLERLRQSSEPVPPAQAYNIVEDYPTRYALAGIAEAPSKGPDDAGVVLVEFSDFECPYCQRYSRTIRQVVETFPDDVQVRFMHYPLNSRCNPYVDSEFHVDACRAARAAVCAADQHKFWELHDLMFDNNHHLDRESIHEMAGSLGVDPDEFEACLDSDYSLERVQTDIEAARSTLEGAGIDSVGTPFSFVNGLLVRGSRTFPQLEALIGRELEAEEGTGEGSAAEGSGL